jgi:alpha-tubulin suppressor-like RCC1 family protein
MAIRKSSGLLLLAGMLASVLLSGCGSSSSTNTNIPSTATIFYGHSVIFGSHSTVLTTGYNGFGQLGNGNLNSQSSLAATVPALGPMDRSATGADHTLVLAFSNVSSVYAWGSNNHGQIGSSIATTGTGAFSSNPVKIPLHGAVTEIAAGGFHSLAVVDGTAYAWGYNGYGQLGDDTFADNTTPKPVKASVGGNVINVTRLAAGGGHSLALTNIGTIYAWGYNGYGQLGKDPTAPLNTYANIAEPVQVNGAVLQNIVQIAAGGSSSYALENDVDPDTGEITTQKLWAWGYNGMGQLGLDPATTEFKYTPTAIALPATAGKIAKISAGWDHLLMLADDGTVWAVGFNGYGQLGNNDITSNLSDTTNKFTPVQVLGPTGGILSGVTDIIAFGNHSLARVSGVWYGWGDNGFGQLGNPVSTSSIGYLLAPTLVQGFF